MYDDVRYFKHRALIHTVVLVVPSMESVKSEPTVAAMHVLSKSLRIFRPTVNIYIKLPLEQVAWTDISKHVVESRILHDGCTMVCVKICTVCDHQVFLLFCNTEGVDVGQLFNTSSKCLRATMQLMMEQGQESGRRWVESVWKSSQATLCIHLEDFSEFANTFALVLEYGIRKINGTWDDLNFLFASINTIDSDPAAPLSQRLGYLDLSFAEEVLVTLRQQFLNAGNFIGWRRDQVVGAMRRDPDITSFPYALCGVGNFTYKMNSTRMGPVSRLSSKSAKVVLVNFLCQSFTAGKDNPLPGESITKYVCQTFSKALLRQSKAWFKDARKRARQYEDAFDAVERLVHRGYALDGCATVELVVSLLRGEGVRSAIAAGASFLHSLNLDASDFFLCTNKVFAERRLDPLIPALSLLRKQAKNLQAEFGLVDMSMREFGAG